MAEQNPLVRAALAARGAHPTAMVTSPPVRLKTPDALLELLVASERRGFTHVVAQVKIGEEVVQVTVQRITGKAAQADLVIAKAAGVGT